MTDNTNIYIKAIATLNKVFTDLKKNIIILIVSIGIVTGILASLNYKKSECYTSSFTVVYEDLVRKIYGDKLDKLDVLIQNNKTKAAELLGVDNKVVSTIKEIYGTNILGDKLSKDMNIDKIPFVVNMTVTDTNNIQILQKSILNFLENSNTYLIEKRKLRMKEIADEIAFIDHQLSMMDTLKQKQYITTGSTSGNSDKNTAPADVYSISYELFKKKQELSKKLEMPMNLYVIDDAIVPVSTNKPFKLIAILGLAIGFIIYAGLVYIFIPAIRYKQP